MNVAGVLFFLSTIAGARCRQALVRVQQGWLAGERRQTITRDIHYNSFKGIPYAEPPLGDLRFMAPKPPLPWRGLRSAKEHGDVCTQVDILTGKQLGTEDCLFLNVYTPHLSPSRPLSVMVFIHGGGFQSWSGNSDLFGPDFLVRKNVVLVTLNYRLDSLGFLCLDTEAVPGNAGLKDQVAALRWVQINIKEFGGDPNRVTIFGQSAGGVLVAYHLLSPLSKGLFQRVISMSGSPYCDWAKTYFARRRAFQLGKSFGLQTKNDKELIEFLQSLDATELVGNLSTVLSSEKVTNNLIKHYSFAPVIEKVQNSNTFLPLDPRELLKAGSVNQVDVMFGYTNAEGVMLIPLFEDKLLALYNKYSEILVPTKILYECEPDIILSVSDRIKDFYFGNKSINVNAMREFVDYASNATFAYNIQRIFRDIPLSKINNIYFYKFSSVSGRNYYGNREAKYGITGTAHVDDLMYLFNAESLNMTLEKNSLEYELVEQATTVFTNFAKYGNPTPDAGLGISWPQFDNKSLQYVDIGQTLSVASAPDQQDLYFWKSILEYAGIPFFLEQYMF